MIKLTANKQAKLNEKIKNQKTLLVSLREQIGNDGLSANEIARLNQEANTVIDEKVDPEVAAIIADEELGLRENLLSLKVTTASFDRVALIQQIGG